MENNIKKDLELLNLQIKELSAIYRHAINKLGVSDTEFWIWYTLLIIQGEYSQQDICDICFLPKQTVNSVISNLIKKDYIYLEVLPKSRNRKIIRISDQGQVYGQNIVSNIYDAELRSIAKLPKEERQMFIMLLKKYINILKEEINE